MKISSFFYPVGILVLLILCFLSGCVNDTGPEPDAGSLTVTTTPVADSPEPARSSVTAEPVYQQEHISLDARMDIMKSVPAIPYLAMDEQEKDLCIRSDTETLIAVTLKDTNAQDMLMKGGLITGIGPSMPRSGRTKPADATCTAAVYISGRNITSAFVIDQEKQIVSSQVIEVPPGIHVRTEGNRTIVRDNDRVVFIFSNALTGI